MIPSSSTKIGGLLRRTDLCWNRIIYLILRLLIVTQYAQSDIIDYNFFFGHIISINVPAMQHNIHRICNNRWY